MAEPDFGPSTESFLDAIEVSARWDDGTVVPGAIELLTLWEESQVGVIEEDRLLWRPERPLERTGLLTVQVEFSGTDDCPAGAYPETIEVLEAADAPLTPDPPKVAGLFETSEVICCDGAYPSFGRGMTAGELADDVVWGEGECILPRSLDAGGGQLFLRQRFGPDNATQWLVEAWDDERLLFSQDHGWGVLFAYPDPFELQVRFRHLGTGEVIDASTVPVPGDVAFDALPWEEAWDFLDARCEGTPYTCDSVGNGDRMEWDPDSCLELSRDDTEPVEPGAEPDTDGAGGEDGGLGGDDTGDAGCTCTARGESGPFSALLGLCGFGALRRRRHAR